ncbi:YhgE/Pip domain-containing protein, partial [Staphylococcus epidermidis]|uniref:hypothetical protein n=1 Tax=Staphylococcus epidermidis TaxID=1282 RepID=UPI0028CB2782
SQFLTRKKPHHEIDMRKYYPHIYIPKKFTHQITATLTKHPQNPDIHFKLNHNINPLPPNLTHTPSSFLIDKPNKQFNKTV